MTLEELAELKIGDILTIPDLQGDAEVLAITPDIDHKGEFNVWVEDLSRRCTYDFWTHTKRGKRIMGLLQRKQGKP